MRAGVKLTPLKTAIFDAVKRAGDEGITTLSLASTVYEGRKCPAYNTVKAHVWQINEILEETNVVITNDHRGNQASWRLERRKGTWK
jgi:predicted transcriptional regulator